jgi:hypothetical protein
MTDQPPPRPPHVCADPGRRRRDMADTMRKMLSALKRARPFVLREANKKPIKGAGQQRFLYAKRNLAEIDAVLNAVELDRLRAQRDSLYETLAVTVDTLKGRAGDEQEIIQKAQAVLRNAEGGAA